MFLIRSFATVTTLLLLIVPAVDAGIFYADIPSIGAEDSLSIEEDSQVSIPLALSPVGLFTIGLPTHHDATASAPFNNDYVKIEYPDIVNPGETISLTTEVVHLTLGSAQVPRAYFNSDVTYGLSLGLTDFEDEYHTIFDLEDFPSSPYTGNLSGYNSDNVNAVMGKQITSSTDQSGYNGISPVVPSGAPTDGFLASAQRSFDAWQLDPIFLFEGFGSVLPFPASLMDIEIAADLEITEKYTLSADLFTAYYSYDGLPSESLSFAINALGTTPTIEIPTTLTEGDIFDVMLDTIVMNYSFTLDYFLNGSIDYQFQSPCLDIPLVGKQCVGWGDPAFKKFNNELIDSWTITGQKVFQVNAPMTFEIASAPVPEPSTMLLLGAGLLGLAGFCRRKFRTN